MNERIGGYVAALITALVFAGPSPAWADEHQAASWQTHQLEFTFVGYTSRYTCSGLQDRMRQILLSLGAREDQLQVDQGGCSGRGDRPARIASVQIKAATLQPSATADAVPGVDAYWKRVTIGGIFDDLDCQLIDQVRTEILPLFATRNVKGHNIDCVPYQATIMRPRLTLEVLTSAVPAPVQPQ